MSTSMSDRDVQAARAHALADGAQNLSRLMGISIEEARRLIETGKFVKDADVRKASE